MVNVNSETAKTERDRSQTPFRIPLTPGPRAGTDPDVARQRSAINVSRNSCAK